MFKYISVGKKYLESSQVASCWNFLQRNQVRLCNPWESSYHSPGRTLKVLGWSQTQPRSCGYRDTDLVCGAIMSHLLLESLPDLWISIQSQTWRQNLRLKNAIPKSSIFFSVENLLNSPSLELALYPLTIYESVIRSPSQSHAAPQKGNSFHALHFEIIENK